MTVLQGFLLGILQGIAEFLPISSSGHLALAQSLFGLEDVPLLYDIFLHMATLLAVTIYFWPKIWALLKCFGRWITKKQKSDTQVEISENDLLCPTDKIGQKTIIAIILTTAITGAFGIFTSKLIPDLSVKFVCGGFLVTSALLIFSSIMEKRQSAKGPKEFTGISIKQSIIIGIMQGFGTLPGISRSGSTIAGALFGGVNRSLAGELSFIVSIPAILGAFILELKDLGQMSSSIGAAPIIAGCISSFSVGYFSLSVLMKIIKKGKLQWFAAYLIPAGILGLIFLK